LFTDPLLKSSPAALVERKAEPDYICSTLTEAIDFIARHTEGVAAPVEPPPSSALQGEGGGESRGVPTPVEEMPPKDPAAVGETAPNDVERLTPHPNPLPQGERGPEQAAPAAAPSSSSKLESLAGEILRELRRGHEHPQADFSVSKLMAGVVQVIVLAVLFMAFLSRDGASLQPLLVFALTLQTMTIALLIMGRQR
jgi:hypothetical protein